jgi:hypothetical protein
MYVHVQDGFFFLAVGLRLLPECEYLAQHLDVEPESLGFGELVPDIVGDAFALLVEALNLIDQSLQFFLR